jgi:hypothetical protein
MNCKQTEALLPLYAGRDLEEKRAALVTEHLQTCAACARVADEYRESVQLTEQFAPPIFSDAVYAGVRQRVLRELETDVMAPAWSQTIASLLRSRLTWATAGALLIVVSMFAIYFIMKERQVEQQLAQQPPVKIQPGTKERSNSGPQDNRRAELPSSPNIAGEKQHAAGIPQLQRRKRSRDTLADRMKTVASPETTSAANNVSSSLLFPRPNSAALSKPLRVEIQTRDPMIRIIWFVQPETKPIIPVPKGT